MGAVLHCRRLGPSYLHKTNMFINCKYAKSLSDILAFLHISSNDPWIYVCLFVSWRYCDTGGCCSKFFQIVEMSHLHCRVHCQATSAAAASAGGVNPKFAEVKDLTQIERIGKFNLHIIYKQSMPSTLPFDAFLPVTIRSRQVLILTSVVWALTMLWNLAKLPRVW